MGESPICSRFQSVIKNNVEKNDTTFDSLLENSNLLDTSDPRPRRQTITSPINYVDNDEDFNEVLKVENEFIPNHSSSKKKKKHADSSKKKSKHHKDKKIHDDNQIHKKHKKKKKKKS